MAFKFIVALLLALVVALFALQNSASVEINVLFAKYKISQALVILISAFLGALTVLVLSTVQQVKTSLKLKGALKTISKLEEENKSLKDDIKIINALKSDAGSNINTEEENTVNNNEE